MNIDDANKLVDNLGSEKQVREGRSKAALAERRRRDRWLTQLESAAGRAVLWDILEECKAFTNAFDETDAKTNHNTGRQAVGHAILAWLHAARPTALIEMMQENQKGTI